MNLFSEMSKIAGQYVDDVNKRRLSCSRPRAVQCTSLPSLTLPPITTLERCKSTRILTLRQITTQKGPAQQHFKTNHLKKSPFDIEERLFLNSFEIKSSVQRDPLDISGGLRKPTAKTSLNDSSAGLQGTWSAM